MVIHFLTFLISNQNEAFESIRTLLSVEEVQLVFVLNEKTFKVLPNKIKQFKMFIASSPPVPYYETSSGKDKVLVQHLAAGNQKTVLKNCLQSR
jgi:hypothetical protein